MATGDTAKAGQTQQADRRKESQPAAVREPNRRAGRHRSPPVRFSLRRQAAALGRSRWKRVIGYKTCSGGATSIAVLTRSPSISTSPKSLQAEGRRRGGSDCPRDWRCVCGRVPKVRP
jgi:hypothetical protein